MLSWKLRDRIYRRVVTRILGITTVLATYCRELDIAVAAVLLAKGVLQDLPSAADPEEVAHTRDSIGERPIKGFPTQAQAVRHCLCYMHYMLRAHYQSGLQSLVWNAQAGCFAGKHLQHLASRFGEAATGDAAGWLRRRPKIWELPHSLHQLAEVRHPQLIPPDCNLPSACR